MKKVVCERWAVDISLVKAALRLSSVQVEGRLPTVTLITIGQLLEDYVKYLVLFYAW